MIPRRGDSASLYRLMGKSSVIHRTSARDPVPDQDVERIVIVWSAHTVL
jgi:hypothetical protein